MTIIVSYTFSIVFIPVTIVFRIVINFKFLFFSTAVTIIFLVLKLHLTTFTTKYFEHVNLGKIHVTIIVIIKKMVFGLLKKKKSFCKAFFK